MTRHIRTTGQPGAATEQIAALGPFFAFTAYPPHDRDTETPPRPAAGGAPAGAATGDRPPAVPGYDAAPWQRLDGAAVAARVTAVRGRLAAAGGQPPEAVEVRVAASVGHLGLAARLLSPELAAAVLHGTLLDHTLAAVRWQPVLGGPAPLLLPAPPRHAEPGEGGPRAVAPNALVDAFAARLGSGPLAELAAHHVPFGVSPHILAGNTASAVNGAAAMIAAARPALAHSAIAFAAALLDREPLRAQADRTAAGTFRRRSCCLIYRAAPGRRGALCGDCALHRALPPGSRRV